MSDLEKFDYDNSKVIMNHVMGMTSRDGGDPVAVAVMDDEGEFIGFYSMKGVLAEKKVLAINMAHGAAREDYNSSTEWVESGGVTMKVLGDVIAGIGVCGRTPSENHKLANEACNFYKAQDKRYIHAPIQH